MKSFENIIPRDFQGGVLVLKDGQVVFEYCQGNADHLWRKRFHLDEMPIEKFGHYLQKPDDWEQIQDHDSGFYYKYAPEYTLISEKDDRDGVDMNIICLDR